MYLQVCIYWKSSIFKRFRSKFNHQELHGGDEDDDEQGPAADEDQLRRNYEEILGAMMKAPWRFVGFLNSKISVVNQQGVLPLHHEIWLCAENWASNIRQPGFITDTFGIENSFHAEVSPAEFLPCLPQCAERIQHWVATKENKAGLGAQGSLVDQRACLEWGPWLVLGVWLTWSFAGSPATNNIHMLQKCVPENFSFPLVFGGEKHPMLRKEHSESAWPIFMPKIFESIFDADADARTVKPRWLMCHCATVCIWGIHMYASHEAILNQDLSHWFRDSMFFLHDRLHPWWILTIIPLWDFFRLFCAAGSCQTQKLE